MRLVFKKLRTPASTIKVSFDGETYRTYDVNTIKNQGYIEFTEQDCPDLTKLKIQGQFSTIDSVEVNKNILIEGNLEGILCNYEKPIYNEVHYYCFAWDNDNNGEISDEELPISTHTWLKGEIANNRDLYTTINWTLGIPESADDLTIAIMDGYGYVSLLTNDKTKLAAFWLRNANSEGSGPSYDFIRYPAGDLIGYEPTSEIESLSDIIVEIQEEPTITKNGKYYADDGKAFKSVNVNISSALYKYNIINKENQDTVIAFSTVRKDQLDIGDPILVLTNQGVLNPVYIRADDYNTYTFPYIGKVSINEIIQEAGEIIESPK